MTGPREVLRCEEARNVARAHGAWRFVQQLHASVEPRHAGALHDVEAILAEVVMRAMRRALVDHDVSRHELYRELETRLNRTERLALFEFYDRWEATPEQGVL